MPAVSKAQQKFFGIVRAIQKGEMAPTTPETAKAAAEMKKKDVKDFASTKHKNLPDKMDVNEIYSSSDAGRAERIKRYDAEKKKFAKDDKRKKFGKFIQDVEKVRSKSSGMRGYHKGKMGTFNKGVFTPDK
jgi:hypothetical protein